MPWAGNEITVRYFLPCAALGIAPTLDDEWVSLLRQKDGFKTVFSWSEAIDREMALDGSDQANGGERGTSFCGTRRGSAGSPALSLDAVKPQMLV